MTLVSFKKPHKIVWFYCRKQSLMCLFNKATSWERFTEARRRVVSALPRTFRGSVWQLTSRAYTNCYRVFSENVAAQSVTCSSPYLLQISKTSSFSWSVPCGRLNALCSTLSLMMKNSRNSREGRRIYSGLVARSLACYMSSYKSSTISVHFKLVCAVVSSRFSCRKRA